ncbi:MAG: hypothetical protein MJZ22_04535 [Candidatus Saccharibacteria bacterium]|nr:hypothetical protein [Candidatus Saccharibacteria bacterium]
MKNSLLYLGGWVVRFGSLQVGTAEKGKPEKSKASSAERSKLKKEKVAPKRKKGARALSQRPRPGRDMNDSQIMG